jgi:tRNA nucleotidyltransferase/poly(A) polymerase
MAYKTLIPDSVYDILTHLHHEGFACYLIGGMARSFLLKKDLPLKWDLDFEIALSSQDANLMKQAPALWQTLAENLARQHKGYFNRFKILQLKLKCQNISDIKISLEITPPRKEIYHNLVNPHHSEFEIEIDFSLALRESLKRRDFTVGAIALKCLLDTNEKNYVTFEIVDPFLGIRDLENQMLRPVNLGTFHLDPVRAFRAWRFLSDWNWPMNETLKKAIDKISFDHSRDYQFFRSEYLKCSHQDRYRDFALDYNFTI